MQDEINGKMAGLAKQGGKTTLRLLWKWLQNISAGVKQFFAKGKDPPEKNVVRGKTTMKKLSSQDKGMQSFTLPEANDVAQFDRIMKRYGVDYAVRRDTTGEKPKAVVFFKGQDADAFTQAFQEFTNKKMKGAPRKSVLKTMAQYQDQIKGMPQKEKIKEHSR